MIRALLETPFFLFLLVFFPTLLLLRRTHGRYPGLLALCGVLSAGVFLGINLLNIVHPGFFWHDEVSILSVSAAYLHGEPVYHAPSAAALYSLLYGPSTFLVYLPFLAVAGSGSPMTGMRLGTCLINFGNLALLYLLLRQRLSRTVSLGLLPLATAFLLALPSILLGMRGDVWLLFCLTSALLLALRPGWLLAALGAGIFAGLALDFKVTIAPVVCLLLVLLYRRHGLRATLLFAVAAAGCAGSLFLLPGISLQHYLDWLTLSRHQGFLGANLVKNLYAAAFLLVAGVMLRLFGSPASRAPADRPSGFRIILAALAALALVASILTGSKDGAGAWHLWPMLPFLLFWTACEVRQRTGGSGESSAGESVRPEAASPGAGERALARNVLTLRVVAAIAIAGAFVTLRYGLRDFRIVHPADIAQEIRIQRTAEREIHELGLRFRGRNLAMGYGKRVDSDATGNLRFELPLEGEDYFFDENAVVEATKAGFPMPQGLVQRILGCSDIWLIPHGEEPFSTLRTGVLRVTNTPYLFPDSIRLGFAERHTLAGTGESYDLWTCAAPKT